MSTAVIGFAGSSRSSTPLGNSGRASAQRRSSEAPKLRLTRRGRAVVTVLIAVPLAIAALFGVVNTGGAAATNSSSSASFTYVTVGAGESLWQIATDVAPKADPRDVIADIVDLNQLASTDLQAGQRLAIPLKYEH